MGFLIVGALSLYLEIRGWLQARRQRSRK